MTYVRLTLSDGSGGIRRTWSDSRDDILRRATAWRAVFETGGVTPRDRVMLILPLTSAIGSDCQIALFDIGALTTAVESTTVTDVLQFEPSVMVSTPTEVLRLVKSAANQHIDLADGPLRLVVVTGEPGGSLGVTRRAIEERCGSRCLDVYALTELGVVGWTCLERPDGIQLDDTYLVLEVVEPESDRPVGAGELGELVVTTPDDWGTPLVRFRTGDLVRVEHVECGSNRGSVWAEGGVLGRSSELMRVRGHDLLPSSIEQVVWRHPAVVDFRLLVYQREHDCELAIQLQTDDAVASEGDRARVAAEVSEDLKRSLGVRLHCDVAAPDYFLSNQGVGHRARRLSRQ